MSLSPTIVLATSLTFFGEPGASTDSSDAVPDTLDLQGMVEEFTDSALMSFTFQHGTIELDNGVASITLPEGFKFLDSKQSQRVLEDLWGNPEDPSVLGMIFPEKDNVLADSSFAFVLEYDEIGYVKDDDADDINYDELMKELQEGEAEDNKQRTAMGYDPAYLIGWAAEPFYDKERKVLHWAKEIKFGDSAEVNTLNYNVRVLGRKGVLILNAVASMNELSLVQAHVPDVLGIVEFKDGYKYEQFDSSVDDVAAWTIGGLVAGKVLTKVGLFAGLGKILLKFGVVIIAALAGLWKLITGRKKKDSTLPEATTYKP